MPDDDLISKFPLLPQSPAQIIARMLLSVNAGIDPSDPSYADDVPGSWFSDMSGAYSLEGDRLYDRATTEVPAAALPTTAIGDWLDGWADVVGLLRKVATFASGTVTFAGTVGTEIPIGAQVSTEAPTVDSDPLTYQTTIGGTITGSSVDLPVQALESGSASNVAPNSVTILNTPIDGVSITNAEAITSGSDVETDEALSGRVTKKIQGTNGAGNNDYYANLAMNYPGVGYVKVKPNTPSIGHVTIVIADVDRNPASSALVDGLQAQIDPSTDAGQGAGLAAPGATVIVATTSADVVTLAGTLVLETGYSLDGSGGTINVSPDILTSVSRYFTTLLDGDDVIHNKVLAAIIDVTGVADMSGLTLNTASGNLTVADGDTAELNGDISGLTV